MRTKSMNEEDEMSADHSSYEDIARQRRGSADYRQGYDEAHAQKPLRMRPRSPGARCP